MDLNTLRTPKNLVKSRREQTVRMLQQTHRATAFLASLAEASVHDTIASLMNNITTSENPPSNVSTNLEAAKSINFGVMIGFPSTVLVFLLERFKRRKAIKIEMEKVLRAMMHEYETSQSFGLQIKKLSAYPVTGYKKSTNIRMRPHPSTPTVVRRRIERDEEAILRHIRNTFAHGNWSYDEQQLNVTEKHLILVDYDPNINRPDQRTFAAEIGFGFVVDLTERLLLTAFNHLA